MGNLEHPLFDTRDIKWVFLDLDNTLWDFDANAKEALKELYERHQLHLHCDWHVDAFINLYQDVNAAYWKRYEKGEVDKETLRTARFYDTFNEMGIPAALQPVNVWQEYLDICPVMTILMPGAMDALKKISKKFKVAILTNGFEKTQQLKLQSNGLLNMVDLLISSEQLGIAKPNCEFFETALSMAGVGANEVIYIGDNWHTDVIGGVDAGIVTFWYQSNLLEELNALESEVVNQNSITEENESDIGGNDAWDDDLIFAAKTGVLMGLVDTENDMDAVTKLEDFYGGAVGDWSKFSQWLCD